jgi:hypothetical protein
MRRFAVILLLLWAAPAAEGFAQIIRPQFTSEADPKNYAHASFLGSGIYYVNGRQIYILRLDMSLKLRSEEEERWGMRFTLTPTIGFYDFKSSDEPNFELPGTLGSLSVLPGVEFRVPIFDNWRLDPFVQAGPALELETDTVTWIYGLGVNSRAEFPARSTRLLLWNELLWAGNFESGVAPSDSFLVFKTTLEWRRAIRWSVEPPVGEGIDIDHRYEVGLTWGPTERFVKWKISIPRIGLTYRFGEGDSGYRLLLTTRF